LGGVSNSALDGHLVMAVFDPPGPEDLDAAVVAPQRKVEAVDAVAPADLLEQPRRVVRERRRPIERLIHLVEEVGRSGHAVHYGGLRAVRCQYRRRAGWSSAARILKRRARLTELSSLCQS